MAVFSISGGYGVILVDLIEQKGINIPPFSPKIQEKLDLKFMLPGTSSKNPLDLAAQFFTKNAVYETIEIALSDDNIDGLILDLPSFYLTTVFTTQDNQMFETNIIEALSLAHKYKKPIIPIIQRLNRSEERERILKKLIERDIPVFGDPLEVIPLLLKISNYKRSLDLS